MLKKLTPQEIALDIANVIEKSETYDQADWANECGTPGCVAGHIVYVHGDYESAIKETDEWLTLSPNGQALFFNQAKEILDLSSDEARAMFDGWPEFSDHHCYDPTASEAADMLRRWAATGKVEWRRLED